ncbi:MAG TPA: hypothetical protein VFS21_23220 [Roseiflexaceae bacterium]|nr:hypothetical protein [Roseiflexaceae bacterium]
MGWFKRSVRSSGGAPAAEQSGLDQAVVNAAVDMSRRGFLRKLPLVGGAAAGLTFLAAGTAQAATCYCEPASYAGARCNYNSGSNGGCGCQAGGSCGYTRTTCSGSCSRDANGSVTCGGSTNYSCIASTSCRFC